MVNQKPVNVKQIVKGDRVVVYDGIWKVVGVRRTTLRGHKRRCFRLDWIAANTPNARKPLQDKGFSVKCFEQDYMFLAQVRRCFPCYDSDCACVFDGVR